MSFISLLSMNTKLNFWICLLLMTGVLVGCNAYEDGPKITFRSKAERMRFDRPIIKYAVNGVDSLSSLLALFSDSLPEFTGTFRFEYDPNLIENRIEWGNPNNIWFGGWTWVSKFESITIGIPFQPFNACCWGIQRLSSKELWLKSGYDGVLRELRFEEQ